jgi:pyridoxine 5-phosphate synthase
MNPLMADATAHGRTQGTALSVNVNKVALLRNTRHLGIPSVVRAADARPAGGRGRHHRAPAARRAPHP